MAEQDRPVLSIQTIAAQGLKINQYDVPYAPGRKIGVERTAQVVDCYVVLMAASNGRVVPITTLAKEAKVSWIVAKRIVNDYHSGDPFRSCTMVQDRRRGVGSRLELTHEQECFLLWLRFDNPFRTRNEYIVEFGARFEMLLSKSFITNWFRRRFKRRAELGVAIQVPVDKFRPENIDNYDGYCAFVEGIASRRFCFLDEKLLKGSELYDAKGRPDPITGCRPTHIVAPDFRNTYCIIMMCSIARVKVSPFIFNAGK